MTDIRTYNPDTVARPGGQYSHVTRVKASEFLFIAGQVATDRNGALVGPGEIEAQCAQVYANIEAALKSAGAGWSNVVQFTTFIVNAKDMPKLRTFRSREFPKMFPGGVYPPNTMLIIDRLAQEQYLIEVQTIAAL